MLSPEEKRSEIEKIAQQHGGIASPEALVEAARDPEHPLHVCFNWDDASEAHRARLSRARALIREVRIHIRIENRTVSSICYVRSPNAGPREQGYGAIVSVAREEKDAKTVLETEIGRVQSAIDRARLIADSLGLTDLFEARLAAMVVKPARKKAA
jgi:hypothetical protein